VIDERFAPVNAPFGFCLCGCGQRTTLAALTNKKRGHVKGQPVRYVANHHKRMTKEYEVDPETGCWISLFSKNPKGYAMVGKRNGRGRNTGAHRAVYEKIHGPLPPSVVIDHICRNPPCVNPDHLRAVSPAENTRCGKRAKLTMEDAREIRKLWAVKTTRELVAQFGVTDGNIYHIVHNKTWRDG
jgi:hypothetical protein